MKRFQLLLILVASFTLRNANATDPGICEIRSAFMGSVAQERDKGVKREKVKKTLPRKFVAMSPWVDIVYDKTTGMTPQEVAAITKLACLRE